MPAQPRTGQPKDCAFEYLTTRKDELVGWARKFSIFPYPFVTACCAMEFMAVSVCATSGGFHQNCAALAGIDKSIPVDIYIPGCPPRPEMVIDEIMQLQEKIAGSRHPIINNRF